MTLELRGGVRAAPVTGADAATRQVLRFTPDPRARAADPAHVVASARQAEDDGIDSVLVTQSSSWPDPWLVAGWALQATTRLRVVVAHRIGTTAPTVAARALATLDALSGGRAAVHVIIGSSDEDVLRDGDPLPKADRYRRAGEYLEVFTRTLTDPEPFDHRGEFYRVVDAWSGVRPAQQPRPEISFGGTSDAGVELTARYADVYGLPVAPLGATADLITRARAAATAHGRTLRFWRHARFLLADTDEDAGARAAHILASAPGLWTAHHPDASGLVQVARAREEGRTAAAVATPPADLVRAHVERGLAGTFVGSPSSAAAQAWGLLDAGVDVLQVDTPVETAHDRTLRKALLRHLREVSAR